MLRRSTIRLPGHVSKGHLNRSHQTTKRLQAARRHLLWFGVFLRLHGGATHGLVLSFLSFALGPRAFYRFHCVNFTCRKKCLNSDFA